MSATTTTPASSASESTSGLGSGSRAGYLKQITTAVAPWQAAAQKFEVDYGHAVSAQDQAGTISAIDAFKSANDTFAGSLSAITPVAHVKSQQDQMVASVKQLSSDLGQLKTAFSQQNVSLLHTIQPKIKSDTVEIIVKAGAVGRALRQG